MPRLHICWPWETHYRCYESQWNVKCLSTVYLVHTQKVHTIHYSETQLRRDCVRKTITIKKKQTTFWSTEKWFCTLSDCKCTVSSKSFSYNCKCKNGSSEFLYTQTKPFRYKYSQYLISFIKHGVFRQSKNLGTKRFPFTKSINNGV